MGTFFTEFKYQKQQGGGSTPCHRRHAPETLDALSLATGSELTPFTGQHDVDKGVMFTNDREVTTRLAERMREQILDDGTEPLGIRFDSRIANGTCWALWMRRADVKLGSDPVKAHH